MLKINVFSIIIVLLCNIGFSQSNLNDYKYIIVPKKYDFLKTDDQYQLNSLSKFLFEKYGFVPLFDDEPLPDDLINNGCLALYANVDKESGVLKTKLFIELNNCRKEVVFKSITGEAKDKEYKVAYTRALREAFESFESLNYKYEPKEETNISSKVIKPAVTAAALANNNISNSIASANIERSPDKLKAKLKSGKALAYDLVNIDGKTVHTILYSGKEDVYLVKDKNALIYKLNGNWVYAIYLDDNSLEVKALEIIF